MTIPLKFPGELRDARSADLGIGAYADCIGAELVAAADVGAARRGRAPAFHVTQVEPDDVLECEWEDGIVELLRAEDLERHFPQSRRSADGTLTIPSRRSVSSATRGVWEIGLEALQQIRLKISELTLEKILGFAVPRALRLLEEVHMPEPGLHRVGPTGALEGRVRGAPGGEGPYLLLLHGTFSNTAKSFADLFASEEWRHLTHVYGERILALEQHTITESPAGNALQLVADKALPERSCLHVLSHSRGGLVGDLLCRYPWTDDESAPFFADASYEEVRRQLAELRRALAGKQLRVERFARVASPAAGTLLASERLDTYLNVILSLLGKLPGPTAAVAQFVKAVATVLLATRTRADALPGIEAMMPRTQRGFVPFLNLAPRRGRELAVIAGDVRGGGALDRVKDFFSHLYYREDNDFVVDSRSMFRGVPREEARGFYFRSPHADHFSYFAEPETRSRMVEWLADGRADRFQPLNAAQPYGGLRGAPASRSIPSRDEIEAGRRADRPVVFLIPGIMGTHLALDRERQWIHVLRLAWGGLGKLEIGADGVTPDGLVDSVYERLFERLAQKHHVVPFGFDWRLSIKTSADRLAAEIERELDRSAHPVRIVAHSMGGLVSRAFALAHPDLWSRMKEREGRILMLGTPNYGSYVPAQVFTRRHKLTKLVAAADLRNSLDELTRVVGAFPGLVEMLPFRNGTNLLDAAQWAGFGDFGPVAEVLASARAFRQWLDGGAIEPDHMSYVAGHAEATPASMERAGSEVTFRYTGRGDGTVPWDLGFLDGVDAYYVEAEHGQIPNHAPAFDGFLELLTKGRTRRLDETPPVVKRGVRPDGLFELEREEGADELRYYPVAADIVAAIAGEPRDPEKELGPPLEIEVTAGDVREAEHPILVGHYSGDEIVNAEAVLDRELGRALSRDVQLGRYPGALGTARFYPAGENVKGALVVGLGEVGSLRRVGLREAFTAALTEFVIARLAGQGECAEELRISSLLVGTYGGTGIGVEQSMAALVEAALATNARLDEQGIDRRARIRGIEFVDLFLDVATEAGHAAGAIASRGGGLVSAASAIRRRKTCRRSRPASPYASGWSRRLRVRREEDESLTYEVTTDLARSEPFQRPVQWSQVDSLLATVTENDPEAASTLFQYVLPRELIEGAGNLPDVVLDLEPATAAIPWEILGPAAEARGKAPLGTRLGLLRTLSTRDPRRNPRRARAGSRALVIGDPSGVEGAPPLPGAREEGAHVRDLLRGHEMLVEDAVGKGADEIFRALYRYEYDIIHIAAHGEYNPPRVGAPQPLGDRPGAPEEPRPSGVLVGQGRYLGSAEFQNLLAVPSVVFLNCCHLARMEGDGSRKASLRHPSRLAASVAEELIKMGVAVVVAAGWAVSDVAAKVFAETLYEELLGGAALMGAVREARRRAYGRGGASDLTWGAYQVYGDPGARLHWAELRRDGSARTHGRFVSPHEVVEYVSDLALRARGSGDAEEEGEDLASELDRLERELPEAWRAHGEILAELGSAYAELGLDSEAIERYERAVRQSEAPLRAVEQRWNIEARRAASLATSDPKASEAGFEASVAHLRALCEESPSAERYCLIGSAWKRRAKVAADPERKARYLEEARSSYRAACDLDPPNLFYPLSNKVALDLGLGPGRVDPDDLERILRSAEARDDEWARATVADVALIRFLAFDEGSAEQAAQAYRRAFTGGAGTTRRERDSMLDQIAALVEFASDDGVRQRAERVQAVLRSGEAGTEGTRLAGVSPKSSASRNVP